MREGARPNPNRPLRAAPLAALLALFALQAGPPQAARAQQPPDAPAADTLRWTLPDDVADATVDFFNDPRRIRFEAPTRIPAETVVEGDVAVLGGPVTLEGRIRGSVVVVNGSVRLLDGAEITGDLLVVGGRVEREAGARVGGELLVYAEPLRYHREGERIVRQPEPALRREGAAAERARAGRSDFLVTTGTSYNRVEGLPIILGPRVRTAGANPLRVQALVVYRTEAGLTLDAQEMGYELRAEQFLGGRREYRVGLTAHSLIEPIERWQLTDLENSFATFFLHRDLRDHYERRGVSLFGVLEPEPLPARLQLGARWERHGSLAARSPWSLVDNADAWRAQPLVGEGELTTLFAEATLDTRSEADDPSTGWYVRGSLEQALRSELVRPAALPLLSGPAGGLALALPPQEYGRFARGLLDVRRYNRVDPTSRLNFRLLLAGGLDGSPLPPQRQHALGGVGSLPGYALFSHACGARTRVVARAGDAAAEAPAEPRGPLFYPGYGCDAVALLQVEYHGGLALRFRWGGDDGADADDDGGGYRLGWQFAPDWALFVDAGRGWAYDRLDPDGLAVDVGAGLRFEPVGVYLTAPLSGAGGLRLLVRLGPRF